MIAVMAETIRKYGKKYIFVYNLFYSCGNAKHNGSSYTIKK